MALTRRHALGAVALSVLFSAACQARAQRPLVLLVDSATEWPMARFDGDRVVAGLTLELAGLLAARMGLQLQAIARPRLRMALTLNSGEADWVCTYQEAWLPGPWRWSRPFFEQDELLVSRREQPAPASVAELAGQRIGTVLGFKYPELETALGAAFVREDAPNAEANLRKLEAGRFAHAVVSRLVLESAQREGRLSLPLHPPMLLKRNLTQCALGPQAPISQQQLDLAIEQIQRDGSLRALYRRYAADDSTRSSSRP